MFSSVAGLTDLRFFLILTAVSVVTAIIVTPMLLGMAVIRPAVAEMMVRLLRQRWVMPVSAAINGAIVFGGAVAIGIAMIPRTGLDAPLLRAVAAGAPIAIMPGVVSKALLAGLLAGIATAMIERLVFWQSLPKPARRLAVLVPLWERLPSLMLYTGINGEVVLRFALMGLLAWAFGAVWPLLHLPTNAIPGISAGTMALLAGPTGAKWAAILVAALIGGLLPLPYLGLLAGGARPLIPRALIQGLITGGLAGYLHWRYGLETAILAQIVAQIPIQIGRTLAPLE